MNNYIVNEELELKIWKLVDEIEFLYNSRKYDIPTLAETLNMSQGDVYKTLHELNIHHTLKRTPETSLNGKLINGVFLPQDFMFLKKYVK